MHKRDEKICGGEIILTADESKFGNVNYYVGGAVSIRRHRDTVFPKSMPEQSGLKPSVGAPKLTSDHSMFSYVFYCDSHSKLL